ncbi:MAG: aldehyde dehydrogenase family protein [Rivularia sp. (in: Bacteria)]|nr:aldehyde dehydrogenase family protein [Rivularia sp. MS3]
MSKPIEVRNPRTGKYDYVIVPPPEKLLVQQCNRLRRGQQSWLDLGLARRIEALLELKDTIYSARDQLTEALVIDTGRLSGSKFEVERFLNSIEKWCRFGSKLLQDTEKGTSQPFINLQQTAVPYSLVAVITPWNFPLLLSTIDVIPALLAGCAVIVKPSELTPRFMAPLMNAVNNIPELRDILTFIEGNGKTGATLVDNVDLVCFTGNVETGQKVAIAAAERFIPAYLELGGKDPAIVLESADIELATSALLWGSTNNSGQSCHSIERIYVAKPIFEDFYHKLVGKAHKLNLAYPTLESGEIGPIISEKQAAIINEHIEDAVEKGATIHCGGEVEEINGGWWCHPTVMTEVNHDMKLMNEETFGPIMPIMSFSTVEEAIELANDTYYGLSAAVFSESRDEALEIARQIDAGAICINDAGLTNIMQEAEVNSFKFSGLGTFRMGASGLTRFMRKKAFLIKTDDNYNSWWFNQ